MGLRNPFAEQFTSASTVDITDILRESHDVGLRRNPFMISSCRVMISRSTTQTLEGISFEPVLDYSGPQLINSLSNHTIIYLIISLLYHSIITLTAVRYIVSLFTLAPLTALACSQSPCGDSLVPATGD